MHLDVDTLSVVTVFVTALLGALLVFAGLQNRTIRAPMWWGAAYIVGACGLALSSVTDDIANALILLGSSLTWSGARTFDGRKVRPLLVVLAPAACRLPEMAAGADLRIIVVSTALATLALLTAEEFWRGRDEPLMSRWPSIIVLLAYSVVLLARVPATLLSPMIASHALLHGVSFALLAFGTLLFTVVMAFLQLNMSKERTELRHKINSLVDPLSGVANRRAFVEGATGLLAGLEGDDQPLAVLLFDLDHFKQVNDCFGHAVGDAVLQAFAGTATATLGADVLFARIGGEEFASCLSVGDLDEAYAVADRVRRNFAAAAARFGSAASAPTVSVGVTLGGFRGADVHELLSIVDRALYRAKELGRNRVETEAPAESSGTNPLLAVPSIVPIIGPERGARASASIGRSRRAAS